MANPALTDCPADTWVKVAENVTAIVVRLLDNSPQRYSFTYIATTGTPSDVVEDAAPLDNGEALNFATGSDVYVYAHGKAGRVRVDS